MKNSKRNAEATKAKVAKLKKGKPEISKYAAKGPRYEYEYKQPSRKSWRDR